MNRLFLYSLGRSDDGNPIRRRRHVLLEQPALQGHDARRFAVGVNDVNEFATGRIDAWMVANRLFCFLVDPVLIGAVDDLWNVDFTDAAPAGDQFRLSE